MAFPIRSHNNRSEKIGKMRHKAYFLIPTPTRDAAGGEVLTWASGTEFFCSVEYASQGTEDDELGDRLTNVTTARLDTRYRTASPKSRIMFDGLEWEINKIIPDTHKRYLTMELVQYKPE